MHDAANIQLIMRQLIEDTYRYAHGPAAPHSGYERMAVLIAQLTTRRMRSSDAASRRTT